MKLTTLRPRVQTLDTRRVPTLGPSATERPAGRGWMQTRQRVALAHNFRCAGCGRLWLSHRDHIDHIVPRWKGGSDDDSNLQPLCDEPCHQAKTAQEAAERARLGSGG